MNRYYSGSYSFLKERLLEVVKEIQKKPTEKITFVVHTNQMKVYLKEFLTENIGVLINGEFLTVIDLSKKITKKEPLSDFEKQIVLKRMLQKKGYNLDGLAQDIGTIIQQLKEHSIPIEDISSDFLKQIIFDYEDFKGKNFYDREDLHRLAIEEKTDFTTDHLVIFGIHSVPELYRKLFRKVSKLSRNVYVFTHFFPDSGYYINHNHFKKVRDFYEKISDFVSFEKEKDHNIEVAKRIYRFDISDRINSPYIKIYSLPDERSEVKFTAQKIVYLRKKGINYSKIGVVIPQIESYLPYIKDIFGRYHIPYYLTEENRYIDDYSYRKIMELLLLKIRGISKESISGILSDSVFEIENPEEIHKKIMQSPPFFDLLELENYVFQDNKSEKLKKMISTIYNLPDQEEFIFYLRVLREISNKFLKQTEGKDFFENLLDTLEEKKLYMDLFDKISYTDLVDILRSFFEEENREKKIRTEGVTVVSPSQAEGNNFDYLFFLGLNSDRYPDPIKDELLLSKEDLKGLNYPFHVLMQEVLNFCSLFDRNKFIRLSFNSKKSIPSIFLQEVIRITGIKPDKMVLNPILPEEIKAEYPFVDKNIIKHKDKIDKYKNPSLEIFKIKANINFPISATSFQKYPQCPYRFFHEEINGFVEEIKTERKEISPLERGIIIHKILEEFYSGLDIEKVKDPEDFVENRKKNLKERFFSMIDPLIQSLIPSYRPLELKRAETTFHRLISFLKDDLQFVKNNKIKKMLIEKRIEDDHFLGRIDRADIDNEGNIVIYDYKTGEKPPSSINKEIKTKYAQLLVYKRILGEKVKKIGILAVNDRDRKFRYTAQITDTNFVDNMLDLIKKGVFPPIKNSLCDYCAFSDFCPKNDQLNKKIKKMYPPFEELL